jgi:glutamyl-tRNA reductase
MKKQTAMQDLRDDLVDSVESSLKALEEIEDGIVRQACQMVVKKTLEAIIKRVDEELLEMEKEQIVDSFENYLSYHDERGEVYYNETYGGQDE